MNGCCMLERQTKHSRGSTCRRSKVDERIRHLGVCSLEEAGTDLVGASETRSSPKSTRLAGGAAVGPGSGRCFCAADCTASLHSVRRNQNFKKNFIDLLGIDV